MFNLHQGPVHAKFFVFRIMSKYQLCPIKIMKVGIFRIFNGKSTFHKKPFRQDVVFKA